jgi:tetratricopeptide (TPR) repeat protein
MGLPDEEIRRALDVLMAAGLVERVEGGGAALSAGTLGNVAPDKTGPVPTAPAAEKGNSPVSPAALTIAAQQSPVITQRPPAGNNGVESSEVKPNWSIETPPIPAVDDVPDARWVPYGTLEAWDPRSWSEELDDARHAEKPAEKAEVQSKSRRIEAPSKSATLTRSAKATKSQKQRKPRKRQDGDVVVTPNDARKSKALKAQKPTGRSEHLRDQPSRDSDITTARDIDRGIEISLGPQVTQGLEIAFGTPIDQGFQIKMPTHAVQAIEIAVPSESAPGDTEQYLDTEPAEPLGSVSLRGVSVAEAQPAEQANVPAPNPVASESLILQDPQELQAIIESAMVSEAAPPADQVEQTDRVAESDAGAKTISAIPAAEAQEVLQSNPPQSQQSSDNAAADRAEDRAESGVSILDLSEEDFPDSATDGSIRPNLQTWTDRQSRLSTEPTSVAETDGCAPEGDAVTHGSEVASSAAALEAEEIDPAVPTIEASETLGAEQAAPILDTLAGTCPVTDLPEAAGPILELDQNPALLQTVDANSPVEEVQEVCATTSAAETVQITAAESREGVEVGLVPGLPHVRDEAEDAPSVLDRPLARFAEAEQPLFVPDDSALFPAGMFPDQNFPIVGQIPAFVEASDFAEDATVVEPASIAESAAVGEASLASPEFEELVQVQEPTETVTPGESSGLDNDKRLEPAEAAHFEPAEQLQPGLATYGAAPVENGGADRGTSLVSDSADLPLTVEVDEIARATDADQAASGVFEASGRQASGFQDSEPAEDAMLEVVEEARPILAIESATRGTLADSESFAVVESALLPSSVDLGETMEADQRAEFTPAAEPDQTSDTVEGAFSILEAVEQSQPVLPAADSAASSPEALAPTEGDTVADAAAGSPTEATDETARIPELAHPRAPEILKPAERGAVAEAQADEQAGQALSDSVQFQPGSAQARPDLGAETGFAFSHETQEQVDEVETAAVTTAPIQVHEPAVAEPGGAIAEASATPAPDVLQSQPPADAQISEVDFAEIVGPVVAEQVVAEHQEPQILAPDQAGREPALVAEPIQADIQPLVPMEADLPRSVEADASSAQSPILQTASQEDDSTIFIPDFSELVGPVLTEEEANAEAERGPNLRADAAAKLTSITQPTAATMEAEPVQARVEPIPQMAPSASVAADMDDRDDADSLYRAMNEIDEKLKALEKADLYQILGVDKLASTARISRAYSAKKEALNPYHNRWTGSRALHEKVDTLLHKYGEAYATLGDLEKRRIYDQPSHGRGANMPPANFEGNSTSSTRITSASSPSWLRGPANSGPLRPPAGTGPLSQPSNSGPLAQPSNSGPLTARSNTGQLAQPPNTVRPANAAQPGYSGGTQPLPLPELGPQDKITAEQIAAIRFQQGVLLFKKKDIYTALHLLREAVRLDPRKSEYHYYLGLALSILSRARKAHTHHTGCHVTCSLEGNLPANQKVRHEAVEHMRQAAELDPNNVRILADLAALYKDAGMPKRAEYYLDRAMLLDNGNQVNSTPAYSILSQDAMNAYQPAPSPKKPQKK